MACCLQRTLPCAAQLACSTSLPTPTATCAFAPLPLCRQFGPESCSFVNAENGGIYSLWLGRWWYGLVVSGIVLLWTIVVTLPTFSLAVHTPSHIQVGAGVGGTGRRRPTGCGWSHVEACWVANQAAQVQPLWSPPSPGCLHLNSSTDRPAMSPQPGKPSRCKPLPAGAAAAEAADHGLGHAPGGGRRQCGRSAGEPARTEGGARAGAGSLRSSGAAGAGAAGQQHGAAAAAGAHPQRAAGTCAAADDLTAGQGAGLAADSVLSC